MSRRGTGRLATSVLAGLTATLVPLSPSWATAPVTPVWQATVTPGSGTDEDYFTLTASGGCPAPASNVLGKVYGHGLPASGEVVVGNTSAGVSPYRPISQPVAVTMREVVFQQPDLFRLQGSYRLVLTCRKAAEVQSYGDYVAQIVFDTPTTWHADRPVTSAKGPVLPDPSQQGQAPGSTPNGAAAAPSAAAGPSSASPPGAAVGDASPAGGEKRAEAGSRIFSNDWVAYGVAGLLVVLVLLYLWRTRRSTGTAGSEPAPTAFTSGARR